MSGANTEIVSKSYENDTFTGSTLVQRDTYAMKGQVYAVKTDYYYELISQYDDWNSTIMYRIMECESKGNQDAVNTRDRHRTCNGSYGLMQLSCEHLTDYGIWDSWNDPAENIRVAYDVWRRQGEGAWFNCYQSVTK